MESYTEYLPFHKTFLRPKMSQPKSNDEDEDYDELTLTIKLKAGDEVSVRYHNKNGSRWKSYPSYTAYFTGLLLYKI